VRFAGAAWKTECAASIRGCYHTPIAAAICGLRPRCLQSQIEITDRVPLACDDRSIVRRVAEL